MIFAIAINLVSAALNLGGVYAFDFGVANAVIGGVNLGGALMAMILYAAVEV